MTQTNIKSMSVEELWQTLSNSIQEGIYTNIPSKMTLTKFPWINADIKRLYRRRDNAYTKFKSNKNSKEHYLKLKHQCRKETKMTFQRYLEDILNVTTPTPADKYQNHKPKNKKLYSLLKHSRQDSVGIDTLKKNTIGAEDQDKATILNEQFQSVFTSKAPVSLHAEAKLQDLADAGSIIPEKPLSPHSTMPIIDISVDGIDKLFKNLIPNKAAGPDHIPTIILKNTEKYM